MNIGLYSYKTLTASEINLLAKSFRKNNRRWWDVCI